MTKERSNAVDSRVDSTCTRKYSDIFPYQDNRLGHLKHSCACCVVARSLAAASSSAFDLALIQVSRSDCSALALIQVLSLWLLLLRFQSSACDCSRSEIHVLRVWLIQVICV